jgi:hypothetical protein
MDTIIRVRGDCSPIICEFADADTGAAIDLSSYTTRVAIKTAPSESSTATDYVLTPQTVAGTVGGTVTIDLTEAQWLYLAAETSYLVEIECRLPGAAGKVVMKEQFRLEMTGRVIIGAP